MSLILPSKEFLEIFKKTNGALSVTEAIAIMNIAAEASQGTGIEFGSFHGKSAMSAAYGFMKEYVFGVRPIVGYRLTLVDPIYEDVNLADSIVELVEKATYKKVSIRCVDGYSTDLLKMEEMNNFNYVFVDSGSHQDGLPMQEVKLLEDRVFQNGIIAFHDWGSQFKEVKEASDYLVNTGKYEYIPINWDEIINYVNENNLEEGNQSWHHPELKNPCFVGAVKRIYK